MRNLLAGEHAHANILVQLNRAAHGIRTLGQLARNAGPHPLARLLHELYQVVVRIGHDHVLVGGDREQAAVDGLDNACVDRSDVLAHSRMSSVPSWPLVPTTGGRAETGCVSTTT